VSGPERSFWNYWGKAKPSDGGAQYHRLAYHSLDVAAVGTVYLEQSPTLLDMVSARLRSSRAAFISWTGFFLALHDLGKFSETFQSLRMDLVRELQEREGRADSYTERHDTLGYWIWKDLDDVGELVGVFPANAGLNQSICA
jgi:CRISPR-associated endonuclease/helicase Cas3